MSEMIRKANGDTQFRLSIADMEKMIAVGVLEPGGRYELIDGEIVPMAPMHVPHGRMTNRLARALETALGPAFELLPGVSVQVLPESQLDPDLTVVDTGFDGQTIPIAKAHLIIEVADTTLERDLARKAPLYAEGGAAELWVVDLNARVTHRHRGPRSDGWTEIVRVDFDKPLAALCTPEAGLVLAELGRTEPS